MASALSLVAVAPVEAAMERCLIEVDGKTFLSGRCNVERQQDGSVLVGVGAKASSFFAYLLPNLDRSYDGFWNGTAGAKHAHERLGTLRHGDGCWTNARAKVCASP